MVGLLIGRPRPRSSRLREAVERLFRGSAHEILADLENRVAGSEGGLNSCLEARRADDRAFAGCDWQLAKRFYRLAMCPGSNGQARLSTLETAEVEERLTECDRRLGITAPELPDADKVVAQLSRKHAVDALRLPDLWLAPFSAPLG